MKKTEFLNIDLDLESAEDISPIIAEFSDSVIILNREKENNIYKVSLELSGIEGDPEYLFKQYISLINGLSSQAKKLWFGCTKREFDLGFECGYEPREIQNKLSSNILSSLSNLDASIVITVYPIEQHG